MRIVLSRGKYQKLPGLWIQWFNPKTHRLHHNRLSEWAKVKQWLAESYDDGFRLGLAVGEQTERFNAQQHNRGRGG